MGASVNRWASNKYPYDIARFENRWHRSSSSIVRQMKKNRRRSRWFYLPILIDHRADIRKAPLTATSPPLLQSGTHQPDREDSRGWSRIYIYIYIRGFKNGERPSTMRAIRGEGGKNIELKREGRHLLCFENTHCSIFARFLCSRKMKRNFFSPLPLFFYRKMDTFNEDT